MYVLKKLVRLKYTLSVYVNVLVVQSVALYLPTHPFMALLFMILSRAFGVTLWEIWTMGHQPYPARTNHEVFEFVIHGGRNEKVDGMSNYMYVAPHEVLIL